MQSGDKYVNMERMRNTRPISWIKAARRDFEEFPEDVQSEMLNSLTIAAEGSKSDKAKPFKGVDGGVCSRLRLNIEGMPFASFML